MGLALLCIAVSFGASGTSASVSCLPAPRAASTPPTALNCTIADVAPLAESPTKQTDGQSAHLDRRIDDLYKYFNLAGILVGIVGLIGITVISKLIRETIRERVSEKMEAGDVDKLISLKVDNILTNQMRIAELKFQGLASFYSGDIESAYGTFSKLYEEIPDDATTLSHLAFLSSLLDKDTDIPDKFFAKAIEGGGNPVIDPINYAAYLNKSGRYAKAVAYLGSVLTGFSGSPSDRATLQLHLLFMRLANKESWANLETMDSLRTTLSEFDELALTNRAASIELAIAKEVFLGTGEGIERTTREKILTGHRSKYWYYRPYLEYAEQHAPDRVVVSNALVDVVVRGQDISRLHSFPSVSLHTSVKNVDPESSKETS